MKWINRYLLVSAALLSVATAMVIGRSLIVQEGLIEPAVVHLPDYSLSGPYVHKNLAVYLVHGEDRVEGDGFLTLEEALEQNKAVVHETGNVGRLDIENLANDENIFIQAGDILKGGKQDRMVAYDTVVPPGAGRMPLKTFCVERGRWSRRGGESTAVFKSSGSRAASKDLKLAAKHYGSQTRVWGQVNRAQNSLSGSLNARVNSPASNSSMQLTLENQKVREAIREYTRGLSLAVAGKHDVIGYAFAINGKVNSIDVYASSALFRKLWPRLLKASAVEAVAGRGQGYSTDSPPVRAVTEVIADAERGRSSQKKTAPHMKMETRETGKSLVFKSRVYAHRSMKNLGEIHTNYVVK